MTSLERAKRFIGEKATRLAVAAVPLAALALSVVPANASVIFSTGACFATSGSCNIFQESATGGDTEANWVSMTGSGTSNGGGNLQFGISGQAASGTAVGGTMPVLWDFDITPVGGDSPSIQWSVNFEVSVISGSNLLMPSFTQQGVSSAHEITGYGTLALPVGTVISYTLNLSTDSASAYSVTVPTGSLDLNAGATPEPSTLLLVPMAGAFFFWRRKKRA